MATKKKITAEPRPRTILIKPREAFKHELQERINLGNEFLSRNVSQPGQLDKLTNDAANWNDYNRELIKQGFNNQYSEYYNDYLRVNTMTGFYGIGVNVPPGHPSYKAVIERKKIENCINSLKKLVEKLPLIDENDSSQMNQGKGKEFSGRGFIVHGHDESVKYEVARYIENELGVKTIILHEQVNKGRTIIEKFEDRSAVDFAVALWTADDLGKAKKEENLSDRARQNVVLETGFFLGKLGRANVIVLYESGVEIPSDYSGVIFIPLSGNWKDDLRKEVKAIYEAE